MPKHLSLGTVIEKNRIASADTFILLAEIEVSDEITGAYVETIYLVNNNEDVTHQSNVYTATGFVFDSHETADGIPDVSVYFQDPTQSVMAKCEQYSGGVGWKVIFKLVNSGDIEADPEIVEMVYVIAAKASNYSVEFQLGARNPLSQRFPRGTQWRDKCRWIFKGKECGYVGAAAFCDYTLQGPDGCSVHGNTLRYGALPGIRPR